MSVLLLLGAAGCGGGESSNGSTASAAETTETSLSTTTTTRVVACVAGDLDPRQLAPSMIEDVPDFAREPDDVGNTGPSDLGKAILDDGAPDAERVLNETGFRAGYQRLWTNATGDELAVFVYQFCKEDGARRYASRTPDLFADAGLPIQPVVGAHVGSGFTLASPARRALWLWETTGTMLAMVATYSDQVDDVPGLLQRADDALAAQLERLARPDTDAI